MSTLKFVQTPAVALYTGMSASATTCRVTPYPLDLDGNKLTITDFGDTPSFTVDPKVSTYEEICTFTGITDNGDNTATLTGLTRDVLSKSPYNTSGTGRLHGASAVIVFSDNPQLFNRLAAKENNETITGTWTFSVTPTITNAPSASTDAANKAYVDGVAVSGAPNASTTVKGLVELATQAETDARSTTGGTGALLVITPDKVRSTLLSDGVTDTGSANAYVLTPTPAITAYAAKQMFSFQAANTNTGASTVNISAIGTKTIKKQDGVTDLLAGDIVAGQLVVIEYNATSGFFQTVSPTGNFITSGAYNFGDGSDGNATIASGTTTLTRDMFYNNLTLQTGAILANGGYQIYVKGILTQQGTGKIVNNGNNGGNAGNGTVVTGGTAGTAGAAAPGITIPAGKAGAVGAVGGTGGVSGNVGSASTGISGASATNSIGAAGASMTGSGGSGGSSGGATGGSSSGTPGSVVATVGKISDLIAAKLLGNFISGSFILFSANAGNASPGGGGGGGSEGAGSGGAAGGGGGGSGGTGSNGGWVVVYANRIVVNAGVALFQAKGGNGGTGGNGYLGTAGGGNNASGGGAGAGGAPGNGGCVVVVYLTKSGAITYDVTGGTTGSAGTFGVKSGGASSHDGSVSSFSCTPVAGQTVELALT